MSADNIKPTVSPTEVATGVVLAVVGLAAAWQALSFDEASRIFPLLTAAILGAIGISLTALAVFRPRRRRRVTDGLGTAVLVALAIALWAIGLSAGAGFLISTFILQLSLLLLCGVRKLLPLVGIAVLITALAYLLFAVTLSVPLPSALLPTVW